MIASFKILLAFLFISSTAQASGLLYVQKANAIHDQIVERLEVCGVTTGNPYAAGLPRPLIRVDLAFVAPGNQVRGYFYHSMSLGGNVFEYKLPNGGYSHKIEAGIENFRILTPFLGVFARSYYNTTVLGRNYFYFCGPMPVDEPTFDACIEEQFVQAVTDLFCY